MQKEAWTDMIMRQNRRDKEGLSMHNLALDLAEKVLLNAQLFAGRQSSDLLLKI